MSKYGFNYIDYIFLAFILFSSLLGLARGVWLQSITFGTWVGAAIVYFFMGPHIATHLTHNGMSTDTANWVVLGAVFIVFFSIGFVLRLFAGSLLGVNTFTFFNKMFGLILGFLIALLVITFVVYAANHTDYSDHSDWHDSVFVNKLSLITNKIDGLIHAGKHNSTIISQSTDKTYSTISNAEYAQEMA